MKVSTKLTIATVIIVLTIGTLMVMGFTNFSGQIVTIESVMTSEGRYDGKYLRLEGVLVEGSVNWNARDIELTFQLTDGEKFLNVYHQGIKPDNFTPGHDVILEGHYKGNGLFVAERVQTRCPSSYEEEVYEEYHGDEKKEEDNTKEV